MKCKDCYVRLYALNMSDIDEELCEECADKRIEELQGDIQETTLILWECRRKQI